MCKRNQIIEYFRAVLVLMFVVLNVLSIPRTLSAEAADKGEADEIGIREQSFPIANGTMRVLVAGNPTAPPVLLLHGATFRAELWVETGTLQRLAGLGFYAVAPDLPGHGKYVNTGLSRDDLMWRLIEKMGLSRPVVIGHSLGGAYAMSLMVGHAELLAGAVLIAPAQIDRYLAKLKNCALPVLVLWGGADKMIPSNRSKALLSSLKKSRFVLLPGASHECYVQAPEAFHHAIESFLKEVTKSARE